MSTTPMFAPDGTLGDVPQERVAEATKAGFTVGQELISPKGEPGVVPMHRAVEAMRAGFMPRSMANMPGAPPSRGGAQMQSVDMLGKPQTPESATAALPGYSGRPVTEKDLIPGAVVGGAAAAAMGGPMAAPYAWTAIKSAAAAVPTLAAMEGINYARKNLPGGQYIPAGAEWLPALMHGGKGKVAAAEEGAAEGEVARPTLAPESQSVPLPQQIQPTKATLVDPYRNQVLPPMRPATSTTMEGHGYNPANQQAFVHFKNGNIYRLSGVPPEMYDQFQNAESQGSFYAQNLKGRYQTDLVGKVKATKTAGQQVKSALSK